MIKKIFCVLSVILVLSVVLSGCIESSKENDSVEGIEESMNELDELEKELDSDLGDFESGLDEIENW